MPVFIFIFCAYATQQRVQRIQRTRCFFIMGIFMVRLSIFYFLPYSGSIRLSAKTVTITVAMQHAITIQKKLV